MLRDPAFFRRPNNIASRGRGEGKNRSATKFRKNAPKYAIFSTVLSKIVDTRQSEILTNFLEIARLIPLRTQDICLEISNGCKYCLGLKVEATVERGQKIFKFLHTESPDWINSRWISTEIIKETSPEYLVFV